MNSPFTATDSLPAQRPRALGDSSSGVAPQQAPDDAVDSTAVRWVFAATVAFWLVVFEAGRMLF